MPKQPLDGGKIDESAYDKADAQFRLVSKALPLEHLEVLAREVVRRLAFRLPRHEHHPDPDEIDRLCEALLSDDEKAGDRIIFAARGVGIDTETLYLSYVASAARQLGRMWEDDRITFLQVTLASGRLYRIIRGLRLAFPIKPKPVAQERHVLLALVPQETHTLGIEIATDVFRRRGWDIDMSVNEDQDQIIQRLEKTSYAAIVVVANSESMLAQLISLVLSLRISQPLAPIVVAGNIVGQVDQVDTLVGADAVLQDIAHAPEVLIGIIEDN